MEIHPHFPATERHSLDLQPQALIQTMFAGYCDASPGGHHAMPRQSPRVMKGPGCLPCSPGEPGGFGDLPVGDDFSPRHASDDGSHACKHG